MFLVPFISTSSTITIVNGSAECWFSIFAGYSCADSCIVRLHPQHAARKTDPLAIDVPLRSCSSADDLDACKGFNVEHVLACTRKRSKRLLGVEGRALCSKNDHLLTRSWFSTCFNNTLDCARILHQLTIFEVEGVALRAADTQQEAAEQVTRNKKQTVWAYTTVGTVTVSFMAHISSHFKSTRRRVESCVNQWSSP